MEFYVSGLFTSFIMGIKGLSKVLGDYAPTAMKDMEIKNFFGKFLFHFGFSEVIKDGAVRRN